MANGLSVSRVVRVSVNLQPKAAARRNFGIQMIIGASDVIDAEERIRFYSDIDGVVEDFGVDSEEYQAALLHFSQVPRPSILAVGRWIKTASAARLKGGILPDADAVASAWTAIEDGAFSIIIDGDPQAISGLDFSDETNMNGVAEVISAKLALAENPGSCVWTGERFVIESVSTGEAAEIGYATAPGAGTDISVKACLTAALALEPVQGRAAESPVACIAALADLSSDWYCAVFADTALTVEQHLAVAAFVEAASPSRVYGATITDSRVTDSTYTADLVSQAKTRGYNRFFTQYSRHPYAVVSAFARAMTVNFNANRSTITLKFKQEPGIAFETISESKATALENKRCNVFVVYQNETAILQEGLMAGGAFFDEIHGLDWLQNAVQTECWNRLYQSKTKIPQTDEGMTQLVNQVESVMKEGVNNGLIAPGQWNADGFGQLQTGDHLPKGYYIYAQPVADQPQSEREERKAPPIQVAAKLAGAIHSVDVIIDVNR